MKQLEYFTTYFVPWMALLLAIYAAWLSNPRQVTEHYVTAKKVGASFIRKVAPYFCAAAFVINCILVPEPISKPWLIGILLSLLAFCGSLAVAWVAYVQRQFVSSMECQIQQLELYGRGFDIIGEQHGRHYDFSALSADLHLKTLSVLMKQFIKPEDKTLAAHVRSIYQGEDAEKIQASLQEMILALSQYVKKDPSEKLVPTNSPETMPPN